MHTLAAAIATVDGRAALAGDRLATATEKLAEANATLAALQQTAKEIAARPALTCPACVCNVPVLAPPATVARKGDEVASP